MVCRRFLPALIVALTAMGSWGVPFQVGDKVRIVSNRYGARQVAGTVYSKDAKGLRVRYLGHDGVIYILPFQDKDLVRIDGSVSFKPTQRVEIVSDSFGARGVVGVVTDANAERILVRYWGHDGQSYVKPFQYDELRKL